MSETLYDIALNNLNNARKLGKLIGDDPRDLNAIGYFLQQSLELSLKYMCEINGLDYPKTHDIEVLYNILIDKTDFEDILGDKLFNKLILSAGTITEWETNSRYIKDWFLSYRTLFNLQFIVIDIMQRIAESNNIDFDKTQVIQKRLENKNVSEKINSLEGNDSGVKNMNLG